ncbi:hypothetical protein ACFFX1_54800 [Dactylosporangium sucinum]|uniref:Uncharacterized protein n=1 Tax=Dactylosporangium sucinum TaxID=1424081 RepID=A0A917U428_9ACTN|nr:hypothetical protein [Dactylosporangium sucinum]GGM53619.1 hypothetical protein GCM10007977_063990 [Dactylosporangium sucinum]
MTVSAADDQQARQLRKRWNRAGIVGVVSTVAVAFFVLWITGALSNAGPSGSFDETTDSYVRAIGVFLLGLPGAVTFVAWVRYDRQLRGLNRPPLELRIAEAAKSLSAAARLVDELESEMQVRAAALERIAAESSEQQRLAGVRADEAEAVTKLVESVISSTHARMDRANRRSQLLYFALGVATSVPIGVMINLWTK